MIELVKKFYKGIDLSQFTMEQIEQKAILIKRQKEILSFANTEEGKHFLFIDKSLKDFPIVSVTPNAVIQIADWKNNKPIYTADFWVNERIYQRVMLMLSYFDIVKENEKYARILYENPFSTFLHFAGYGKDRRLPTIFLVTQDFTPNGTGKGNLQKNDSTDFAATRDATDAEATSSDVGFGANASKFLLSRMYMPTDFSAMGAGATGISATVKVTASAKWDEINDVNSFCTVTLTTQPSNTALELADFDTIGHSDKSTGGHLDYTGATADSSTFNNLPLSSVADITGTGYTKYGLEDGHDLNNTPNSVTTSSGLSQLRDTSTNAKTNVIWGSGGGVFILQ